MEYVALYAKHKYILGYFNSNGGFVTELEKIFPSIFKSEVDTAVFAKIPNLGYSEDEYNYTIWDKSNCKTSNMTVPLYAIMFGEYKYTGKNHTFELPTKEALKAANDMVAEIHRQMQLEIFKEDIAKLNELLKLGKGICFVRREELLAINTVCSLTNKCKLWHDGGHNYVIGDPDMVFTTKLKVYVPQELLGRVIGKGGKNVKEMAAIMRVQSIKVLPIEEKSGD